MSKVNLLEEKLNAIKKLQQLVRNRVIGVMIPGKSIENLEKTIEEYKDYDICWASLNLFEPMNGFILSKINKSLDIVFHSYTLSISRDKKIKYEKENRIPRLTKFLNTKSSNLILSTWRLMGSNYRDLGLEYFYERNEKRIILIDYLFSTLTGVNSTQLLLTTLGISNPKKIILFGLDGFKGGSDKAIHSYYKEELQSKEKRLNYGIEDNKPIAVPITSTTEDMQKNFISVYQDYCNRCNIKNIPEIINCSPNSLFTIFRKIDYNQLKGEL